MRNVLETMMTVAIPSNLTKCLHTSAGQSVDKKAREFEMDSMNIWTLGLTSLTYNECEMSEISISVEEERCEVEWSRPDCGDLYDLSKGLFGRSSIVPRPRR